MNLNETLRIMAVIRSEYPSFGGRDLSGGDLDRKAALWQEMFADDEYALAAAALKCFIIEDTKGFAPSVGQIKGIMARLADGGGMDEERAWELLRRAASRSAYGAREEYERLPEELRHMCSPGQLYEWSQMDSDVFNSVIGSHFRKSYRARQESRRRDALLPAEVKRLIAGAAGQAALEDETRHSV